MQVALADPQLHHMLLAEFKTAAGIAFKLLGLPDTAEHPFWLFCYLGMTQWSLCKQFQ